MKRTFKNDAGFTLIELIVAMAMAVIVTAAATSVLLLGLRVNRQTANTANQQITVQSLLNIVEKAAADGTIKDVASVYDSWQLADAVIETESEGKKPSYRVIFGFDSDSQTIYTGRVISEGEITEQGAIVLEGVYASNAIMEGQLLSISIETKAGIYTSAIYCRTASPEGDPDLEKLPNDPSVVDASRNKFLEILKSQYRSRGEIRYTDDNPKQPDDPTYYSEWYIGADYDDNIPDDGWNSRTPWCACYVSWALIETGKTSPVANHPNWFANVDDFKDYFEKKSYGDFGQKWLPGGSKPTAGDLIFFDWNRGDNPQHVGVVLKVDDHMVYTIEGNSAGRVTIRSYSLTDERIIGYGVIFA